MRILILVNMLALALSGCASFSYDSHPEFVTYEECFQARMRREISDERLFQCAVELPEYGFKVEGE